MYKEYDDQELIYLIRENSEEASNILYAKYNDIVSMKVNKYINYAKKLGLDRNDLIQEGMIGLSEALKSYKPIKGTKFASFANLCIERQIISTLTQGGRKKHAILNESFSLDTPINEDGKTLLDFVFDDKLDPSITLESDIDKQELQKLINKNLTPLEKQVLDLRLAGFEYKEIAVLLDKSYKSIDSTLQRLRLKIRKVLTK